MKNLIKGLVLVLIIVLLSSCSPVVEPTPTPEPTPTNTPEPTEIPTPTPYPAKWRRGLITESDAFWQPSGEVNDAGNPIMENARIGKALEGEVYWCKWPIQGDGQKFCEVALGEKAGYFLKVRKLEWLERE